MPDLPERMIQWAPALALEVGFHSGQSVFEGVGQLGVEHGAGELVLLGTFLYKPHPKRNCNLPNLASIENRQS